MKRKRTSGPGDHQAANPRPTFLTRAMVQASAAGILALCATAQAITTEPGVGAEPSTPYQGIIERNVFGLKPPPPPPDPNEIANKTPPPKIILTGITTIGGYRRALLKVPAQPGKGAEAGKAEQSSILREGERDGDLEVLHIDLDTRKVEVSYDGRPVTVEFDKDAGKILSGVQPGAVGPHPFGAPAPTGLPAHFGTPSGGNPGFGMPTRPMRGGFQPQAGSNPMGAGMPVVQGGVGAPSMNVGGVSLPAFGSAPNSYSQPQQVQPQIAPEEQAILIEAQREQAKMQGNPIASFLPPTPLNPTANATPGTTPQTPSVPTPQSPGLPFAPGIRRPPTIPPLPQMPQ